MDEEERIRKLEDELGITREELRMREELQRRLEERYDKLENEQKKIITRLEEKKATNRLWMEIYITVIAILATSLAMIIVMLI